jgi:hypothetical protein
LGSSSFTVRRGAALSLTNLAVEGDITVEQNSTVHLSYVVWRGYHVAPETSLPSQCFQLYETLDQPWRAVSYIRDFTHCDSPSGSCPSGWTPTGVGGHRWYRFIGTGGDALALSPPGHQHCGTVQPVWLSGWAGAGDPPPTYSGGGTYPTASQGVVERTVCTVMSGNLCIQPQLIQLVCCGRFLLWRLPYAPGSNSGTSSGYCTAASGL